jgi:hypothetical protein
VLVLDDCSPEEGWSEELAELCGSIGVQYYRSPRNLGIPRNMNLGLLRGLSAGYDHVVILNSDVVLPQNLVDVLVAVARANDRVASVTAWSNNCSIYSLPNDDPDRFLSNQEDVDWISEVLGGEFGPAGVEIPAAVGFCMLMPVEAVRTVGLFDPVFGRGYCEELDWCLRAKAAGLRNLLAPNTFVYHMGSGSTRIAGLLAGGETTVAAHEKIIDWRYPLFRQQVAAFLSSDIPERMFRAGLRRLVVAAARELGYDIRLTSLPPPPDDQRGVHFVIRPDGIRSLLTGHTRGFSARIELDGGGRILEQLEALAGRPPSETTIRSVGPRAVELESEATAAKLPVSWQTPYPEQI